MPPTMTLVEKVRKRIADVTVSSEFYRFLHYVDHGDTVIQWCINKLLHQHPTFIDDDSIDDIRRCYVDEDPLCKDIHKLILETTDPEQLDMLLDEWHDLYDFTHSCWMRLIKATHVIRLSDVVYVNDNDLQLFDLKIPREMEEQLRAFQQKKGILLALFSSTFIERNVHLRDVAKIDPGASSHHPEDRLVGVHIPWTQGLPSSQLRIESIAGTEKRFCRHNYHRKGGHEDYEMWVVRSILNEHVTFDLTLTPLLTHTTAVVAEFEEDDQDGEPRPSSPKRMRTGE